MNLLLIFYIGIAIIGLCLCLILFGLSSIPSFIYYVISGLVISQLIIKILFKEKITFRHILDGTFMVIGFIVLSIPMSSFLYNAFPWFHLFHVFIAILLLWESGRNKKRN